MKLTFAHCDSVRAKLECTKNDDDGADADDTTLLYTLFYSLAYEKNFFFDSCLTSR